MIPSRPSLPSTISRTLGPVDVCGTGRMTSVPAGVMTRTPRVRSAMSPYLSDCIPDERVAIQPPSVEWVKLSGKCPAVQPRALSCSSSAGPKTPGWTRASRAASSMADTPSMRLRSSETTVRLSSAGTSRLPEMFVPPPKAMTTASASSAARTAAATCLLVAWAHDDIGHAADVALAMAHEIAQALAAGVDHAVERVGRHVVGSDGGIELAAQLIGQRWLGEVEVAQRDRGLGRAVDVEAEDALEERPELGLVRMREGDILVPPAPPLHRAHAHRVARGRARQRGPGPSSSGSWVSGW